MIHFKITFTIVRSFMIDIKAKSKQRLRLR